MFHLTIAILLCRAFHLTIAILLCKVFHLTIVILLCNVLHLPYSSCFVICSTLSESSCFVIYYILTIVILLCDLFYTYHSNYVVSHIPQWSVLQCGHCFCMECIHILVSRFGCGYRSLSLKCPLCREVTHEGEISYVSTRQHGASETSPSVKVNPYFCSSCCIM